MKLHMIGEGTGLIRDSATAQQRERENMCWTVDWGKNSDVSIVKVHSKVPFCLQLWHIFG